MSKGGNSDDLKNDWDDDWGDSVNNSINEGSEQVRVSTGADTLETNENDIDYYDYCSTTKVKQEGNEQRKQ